MMKVMDKYKPTEIKETVETAEAILENLTARRKFFIDPGKNTVKVLIMNEENEIEHFYAFPSIIEYVQKFPSETPIEGQFLVTVKNARKLQSGSYRDSYAIVGNGTKNGKHETHSDKNTKHHRLTIYTAIHQFVRDGEEIDLIVGYPSENYRNENFKNNYIDGILKAESVMNVKEDEPVTKPGEISLEVNGEHKTFFIKNVDVFQEGLGFLTIKANSLNSKRKKSEEDVAVKTTQPLTSIFVDIGGYNINIHVRTGGTYTAHTSLDEVGINTLYENLKEKFRNEVQDASIIQRINTINWREAIETTRILGQEEIGGINAEDFIQDGVEFFIEKNIYSEINSKFGIDILTNDGVEVIFLGGGSSTLMNSLKFFLKDKVKKDLVSFSPVPLWDNVLSYTFLYYATIGKLVDRTKALSETEKSLLGLLKKIGVSIIKNGSNEGFIQKHLHKTTSNSIYDTSDSDKMMAE